MLWYALGMQDSVAAWVMCPFILAIGMYLVYRWCDAQNW